LSASDARTILLGEQSGTAYTPVGYPVAFRDIDGRDLVWLLEVYLGGTVLRWSTKPVDVPTASGGSLAFPGGVDGHTQQRLLALFDDSPGEVEASFTELPSPEGLGSLIAQGAVLGAASAAVSLWAVGTLYEERDVYVVGQLSRPQYGGDRDPVAFTVTERANNNSQVWPPESEIMTSGTFGDPIPGPSGPIPRSNSIRAEAVGATYPYILGQFNASNPFPASRMLVYDETNPGTAGQLYGLLAGGWIASDEVTVVPTDGTGVVALASDQEVHRTVDSIGQPISIISWATTAEQAEATQYLVQIFDRDGGWTDGEIYNRSEVSTAAVVAPAAQGRFNITTNDALPWRLGSAQYTTSNGVVDCTVVLVNSTTDIDVISANRSDPPTATSVFRQLIGGSSTTKGAGDVLIWLLERTDLVWNRGAWEAARAFLNGWPVGCVIEERVDLWDYAQSEILPLLPISITAGAKGIEPVVWRYEATTADAIADIRRGPGVWRSGAVEYVGEYEDVRNEHRLKYAVTALNDEGIGSLSQSGSLGRRMPRTSVVLPASLAKSAGALIDLPFEFTSNASAAKSQSIYGVRSQSLTSNVVHTPYAAHACLQWRAVADGFLHRRVRYMLGAEYGFLRPGDVVSLTDEEIGEVNRVALVAGVERGDTPYMTITLQIVTNPATSSRTTGPNPDGGSTPGSN